MDKKNCGGKGFVLGANFLPSTAANPVEMWRKDLFDPDTIRKELKLAAAWGYNSVRVFLSFAVWERERKTSLHTFDRFLQIADEEGYTVMPVLFDDCGNGDVKYDGQTAPVPFTHNSVWCACPGNAYDGSEKIVREYAWEILSRYAADRRIYMWDLYNEPGNTGRGLKSERLLLNAFAWAREIPLAQPVTAGIWGYEIEPANDALRVLEKESIEFSDVVSFHNYDTPEKLAEIIAKSEKYGKPLICTEWMARQRSSTILDNLSIFKEKNIGCYQWGLVNGRTQTHYPWGWSEHAEPEVWFHDIFRKDGSPYDPKELEYIKQLGLCDRS